MENIVCSYSAMGKKSKRTSKGNCRTPQAHLVKKLCFFFSCRKKTRKSPLISTNICINSGTKLNFFVFLLLVRGTCLWETRRAYVVKFPCRCSAKRLQHHLLAKRQSKKTRKNKQKSFREVGRVQHPLGSLILYSWYYLVLEIKNKTKHVSE